MDKTSPKSLKLPHISRQLSATPKRTRFLKTVFLFVSVTFGVLCGHFLYRLTYLTKTEVNTNVMRRALPKIKETVLSHIPAEERDGVSIKKDMSVQFRDYVPKKYFLNIGGTFPKSIELFLQTYPDAESFHLVSFIPDRTYSPFYEVFDNHTIYCPVWVTAAADDLIVNKPLKLFTEERSTLSPLPTFDLGAWLQNRTHQDDFIIAKIDSPEEKGILENLVQTESIEWIDKYYSCSDKNQLKSLNEITSTNGLHILGWDESSGNYDDFKAINRVPIPPGAAKTVHTCTESKDTKGVFGLLFYATYASENTIKALRLLKAFGSDKKLGAGLFLPYSVFVNFRSLLKNVFDVYHGGMYWNFLENGTDESFHKLRNAVVKATHVCQGLDDDMFFQYIMFPSDYNTSLINLIMKERHLTTVRKSRDISNMITVMDTENATINPKPGELLSLDIGQENGGIFALYLLTKYKEKIIPLVQCTLT